MNKQELRTWEESGRKSEGHFKVRSSMPQIRDKTEGWAAATHTCRGRQARRLERGQRLEGPGAILEGC